MPRWQSTETKPGPSGQSTKIGSWIGVAEYQQFSENLP